VLSAHPQISPSWWWDNHKMSESKELAEDFRYSAALASKVKTNVNSACDVTDLDQIEPISVHGRITIVVQLNHVSWSEFHVGETYHDLNLVQIYDQRWTWFSWTEIWSTMVKRAHNPAPLRCRQSCANQRLYCLLTAQYWLPDDIPAESSPVVSQSVRPYGLSDFAEA